MSQPSRLLPISIKLAIVIFVLLNTSYYWEGYLGGWNVLILILTALVFLFLLIAFICCLFWLLKKRFTKKADKWKLVALGGILTLILIAPRGLINYEKFESPPVLKASREGVAGCGFYFVMRKDNSFYYNSLCFGNDKIQGTYKRNGDILFFKYPAMCGSGPKYSIAIINSENKLSMKNKGTIYLFLKSHPQINQRPDNLLFIN